MKEESMRMKILAYRWVEKMIPSEVNLREWMEEVKRKGMLNIYLEKIISSEDFYIAHKDT